MKLSWDGTGCCHKGRKPEAEDGYKERKKNFITALLTEKQEGAGVDTQRVVMELARAGIPCWADGLYGALR